MPDLPFWNARKYDVQNYKIKNFFVKPLSSSFKLQRRDEKIFQFWLACHTQEEIAEKMHIDRSVVAKIIKNVQKLKLQKMHVPDSIKYFDLWNFSGCGPEEVSKK